MEYNLRLFKVSEAYEIINQEDKKFYIQPPLTDFATVLLKGYTPYACSHYLLQKAIVEDNYLEGLNIIRLANPYSPNIQTNYGIPLVMDIKDIDVLGDDATIVTIGEYPQRIATRKEGMFLEEAYQNKKLPILGQAFHTISPKGINRRLVYIWNNQKYIRMTGNFPSTCKLGNNDRRFVVEDPLWFQVLPVEWNIIRDLNILVSKECLLSGIPNKNLDTFLDYAAREDMFFLELMASEQLENNPRRSDAVDKDLTYAIERMNLAKGVNPEVSSYLDSAIERLELASNKITADYQKVKK